MKRFWLFLLTWGLLHASSAQLLPKRFSVAIEAGVSFPGGLVNAETETYTEVGALGAMSLSYQLSRGLGVGIKVAHAHNGVNGPPDIFPGQKPWESSFFLGKLSYIIRMSRSFQAELEGGGGILFAQLPGFEFPNEASRSGWIRYTQTSTSPAFHGALNLNYYTVPDFFAIRLSVGYYGGRPKYLLEGTGEELSDKIDVIAIQLGAVFLL